MPQWPLLWFSKVQEILSKAGCHCEEAFREGAATAADGKPTPAIYAFTRQVDGEIHVATLAAYDEADLVPYDEIRSLCEALKLDLALFGPVH